VTAVYIFLGCAILAIVCFAIGVGDWVHTHFRIWREKRALARRDAEHAKREADALKWGFLAYPRKSNHIPRASLDSGHRTGRFSVGRDVRNISGVHQ
jgi:hypothetical protein